MKNTGTDCAVENNRKPNTDYTIAAKSDDDKSFAEKSNAAASAANLFVDNSKNKRDKSPTTTCQHNGDIKSVNENIADNQRINTAEISLVNKKCENQHNGSNQTTQSEINATTKQRQQKSICYDFKKGMCRRRFCRVSFSVKLYCSTAINANHIQFFRLSVN